MPRTPLSGEISRGAGGSFEVTIRGALDETAPLEELFARVDGPDVRIHLGGVDRVNSLGIHGWIRFIGPFSAARRVSVEAVSYPMAVAANLIANFFGSAAVRSCIAPYWCGRCSTTTGVLVTREEVAEAGGSSPRKRCARCDAGMELDELDGYFRFVGPAS